MKDQKKKLAGYTAVASSLLGATAAQGQITYVDIADVTVDTHKGAYELDLDSDGESDFRITQYLDTGSTGLIDAIFITPYDSLYGRATGELQNGFSYPYQLVPGDSIGANQLWNGNQDDKPGYLVFQYDGTPYPNSNWKGPVSNGYLGLRVFKDDGFHYGWVRLDVAADNRSFVVKDFAYNETNTEGMRAAEPTLAVAEQMLEELVVGQSANSLLLSKPETFEEVAVRVLQLNGKVVAEEIWTDSNLTLQVPVSNSVVLVEFTYKGVRNSRKVLLLGE